MKARAVLREYLDALIVASLIALFLITFVVRTFYIPTGSMLPTLHVGDVLLVDEFGYRLQAPHRGDIIVFTPPIPSASNFIKRVIAVPGDTVDIHGGSVYVNGRRLNEPYEAQPPNYRLAIKNYSVFVDEGDGYSALDPAQADVPPKNYWQAPDRVPSGFYLVFGDNRDASEDSHKWGFAQSSGRFAAGPLAATSARASIAGRAFLVLWPLNRLHILR